MESISDSIQALIFASEQAITPHEIASCLGAWLQIPVTAHEVEAEIEQIRQAHLENPPFFEIASVGGGYQFLTRKTFAPLLALGQQQKSKKKLSPAAMETLAIIAYRQPVTKPEIEQIRGVNCDYSIQRLLEKDLIQIDGKSEAPGKPLIYSTSKNFMDYFKLDSIAQLPRLKDLGELNDVV